MKRSFLVGILLAITSLVALGQEIKTSLRPSIVNGKLHIAIVIEKNTADTLFPAESQFEAVFDTNFADYSTLSLVYQNPKWSSNSHYKAMVLDRLSFPSDDAFVLFINPDNDSLDVSYPPLTSRLLVGDSDTVGVIQMDIKQHCESAEPEYEWSDVVFRKWEVGELALDRILNTEQEPVGLETFTYTGDTPYTSINVIPNNLTSYKTYIICPEDSTVLNSVSNGDVYRWLDSTNAGTSLVSNQNSINVLNTGKFYLEVDYANGCTGVDSVIIENYPAPLIDVETVTGASSITICNLDSTLLTTILTGASAGMYSWSDGSVGATNYANTTGYHVVTFTDDITGCTSLDSAFIQVIDRPQFDTVTVDSTICKRDTLPLYVRSVLASDSVFIYGLNTTNSVRTLVASAVYQTTFDGVDTSDIGTYVYVADNGFCTTEYTSNINVTDLKTAILPHYDTVCFGESILLNQLTTGGRLPYSYSWSRIPFNNGSVSDTTQSSITALPGTPGINNKYRLKVIDAVGCFAYDTVGYFYNKKIKIEFSNGMNFNVDTIIVCSDGNAARTIPLQAVASGGTPLPGVKKYTYKWFQDPLNSSSTALSISTPNSANPGFIAVAPIPDTIKVYLEVTDLVGCKYLDSIIINLRVFDIEPTVQHKITCSNKADTLGVLFTKPGSGVYGFRWFKDISSPDTVSQADIINPYIKPTISQRVLVEVTDSVLGCSIIDSVRITVKEIVGNVLKSKDILCEGDTVTLNASGSTGSVEYTNPSLWPYKHKYQWSKVNSSEPSSFVNVFNTTDIARIANGMPGTTTQYRLVVTDSIGCVDTVFTNVVWNNRIVSQIVKDTFYVCNTDTILLGATTATGGISNSNFVYDWNRVFGNVILPNSGGSTGNNRQYTSAHFNVTTASDTSLVALSVKDSLGCFTTDRAFVINNNIEFSLAPTFDTTCANIPNRMRVAFLRDSNSTGNYVFNWNDPADASDLFQDSLGTIPSTSIRLPYVITDDTQTYELEITDAESGCSFSESADIFIYNIDAEITIDVRAIDTNIVCYLDQIVLKSDSSTGGTLFNDPANPYKYNWFRSLNFADNSLPTTVTNGRDVSIAANGSEGNYGIWVLELTDKAGCVGRDSTTIYWNNELVPVFVVDTVYVCNSDTARLEINTSTTSGGSSPYQYNWSKVTTATGGGATLLETTGASVRVKSIDNDTTVFSVAMTDSLGCVATKEIVVIRVEYLVLAQASTPQVCQGIDVALNVSFPADSAGGFKYTWSPNIEINDTTIASPIASPTVGRTYTVAVYDSTFKCQATSSVSVAVLDLTAIASNLIGLDSIVMCPDENELTIDGRATFGGTLPYVFSWETFGSTEVNVVGTTSADTIELTRGTVNPIDTTLLVLTVEDFYGCKGIDSVAIYWNSQLAVNIIDSTLYICDDSAKTLQINPVTGGTGSYSYSWSSSDNVQLLSSTNGTSLDVSTVNDDVSKVILTVTDELGCHNTDSVNVEGVTFAVSIQAMTSEICQGLEDTLIAVPSGDVTGSYRYTWSPNSEINTTSGNTVVVTPTVDRTYNVVVYDSVYDCKVANSTTIEIVELVAIAGGVKGLDSVFACFGSDTITVNGLNSTFAGSPLSSTGYTYSWSFNSEVVAYGSTNNDSLTVVKSSVTPIDTTTLRLTVENEFGCTDSDIVTVYWNSEVTADILEDSIYICSDVTKNLTSNLPTGGTGAYIYEWSVVSGAIQLLSDITDTYVRVNTVDNDESIVQLKVMDDLGCSGFDTVKIQGLNFQVEARAKYDSICAGLSDSLFVSVVNGGIGGYSYLWSPNSNINDATIANPVVSPTTGSDYMVTVVDSTTGCEAQSTISISIYQFNAVAGTAGLDTLLRCFGQKNNIQLSAALTNGGTVPYNYLWSTTDATVNFVKDTSVTGVINRTSAGDGSISTIQLLATDNIGCTSRDSIKVLWNSEILRTVTYDISNAFADIVAVCVGVPKVLDNLSVTGGTGNYTYNWLSPDTLNGVYYVQGTRTSLTPTVGAIAIGSQRALNVAITDHATSNATCSVSEEISVRGFDINVDDFTVDEDTVCPNTEVRLTANVSDNVGLVQYSWDSLATYTTSNTSLLNVGASSTTAYVYVRDTLTGCTNFNSVNIEVSSVVATPRALTSGVICYEERFVTLAVYASGGKPGGYTYEWRELPSTAIISTNDTVTVEPPVVGANDFTNYEFTVFDSLGCSASNQVGVRRYDSIVVDAGMPMNVCRDNTITVGGNPTGSFASTTGGLNYSWSGGNFNNSSNPRPIFFPNAVGLRNLVVEVSIPNTNCSVSDTVVVDVKELPIANFNGLSPFICSDSSLAIFANTPNPSYVYPSTTTFEWRKVGTVGVINTNPYADSILVTSGGVYSVFVVDTFLCENSARVELDSASSPVVIARHLDTLGCTNRELILKIDSLKPLRSGELFGDTIKWTVLDGLGYVDEDYADSTFYVPSAVDNFVRIAVEYTNQCGMGVDTVSAVIAEAPIAVLDIIDSTINITESAMFDASNSVSSTGNMLSYQWFFNAPGIENEVTAGPHEKHYNPEGTYPAELYVYDTQTSCFDYATVNIYVNGTHLLYVPNVFSPNASNPENRTLKMYGFGVTDDDFIFTVYNRWGEKVYEQTSFTQAITVGWTGEYKNTGDALDMGVYTYIVRARYVDGTPVEKVGTITLLR